MATPKKISSCRSGGEESCLQQRALMSLEQRSSESFQALSFPMVPGLTRPAPVTGTN